MVSIIWMIYDLMLILIQIWANNLDLTCEDNISSDSFRNYNDVIVIMTLLIRVFKTDLILYY